MAESSAPHAIEASRKSSETKRGERSKFAGGRINMKENSTFPDQKSQKKKTENVSLIRFLQNLLGL